ncbi:MAG: biotin-dependent carboxyltransferase family protein [Candidatus Solibacter sp.]|nr:biotin-dependent carboxyltransferase family protein [Candidatus Solibacter sp.]
MSRIHVVAPGFLTTVQDLGRFGYAHFGVSPSGAADPLALRAGNLLVGNAENAPALEMTLTGGEFSFEGAAVIALTGADFASSVPMWQPVEIRPGETVRSGPTSNGARCYLSVRGGLDVPLVMGSASVHVMTGVGGRPLRRGDVLPIGDRAVRRPRKPAQGPPVHQWEACLRATAGPQARWFGDELYGAGYLVNEESNRMGIRLKGPALPSLVGPDGQPIVLFVEHQTTGGYPKPANVISADFWRLGQLRPRDLVRFERITMEGALALLQEQEKWLYSL